MAEVDGLLLGLTGKIAFGTSDAWSRWEHTADGYWPVALGDDYVLARMEDGDFVWATGSTARSLYQPSFDVEVHTVERTKYLSDSLSDASLGDAIVFAWGQDGRAYFVTATASRSYVTVVVYDPDWSGLGRFTVTLGEGLDGTDCQWCVEPAYWTPDYETRIEEPVLNFVEAWPNGTQTAVGYVPVPSDRWLFVPDDPENPDSPVELTAMVETRGFVYGSATNATGYTENLSLREHLTQTSYWERWREWGWVHLVRRVWEGSGKPTVSATRAIIMEQEGPNSRWETANSLNLIPTIYPNLSTYDGPMYDHDEDVYVRVSANLYVSFEADGWHFWKYDMENDPNGRLVEIASVAYPVAGDVLAPMARIQSGTEAAIAGPVIKDADDRLHLAVLRAYFVDQAEEWSDPLGVKFSVNGISGSPDTVRLRTFAFGIDGSPWHDVVPSGSEALIVADIGFPREWKFADAPKQVTVAAAISFPTVGPHASGTVDHMTMLYAPVGTAAEKAGLTVDLPLWPGMGITFDGVVEMTSEIAVPKVRPGGIAPGEVGTPTVLTGNDVIVGDIGPGEVGTPTLTTAAVVVPEGVLSGDVGSPLVTGEVVVTPGGVTTGGLGTPAVTATAEVSLPGVASDAAVGDPALDTTVTVNPAGVAPGVVGALVVTLDQLLEMAGIAGGGIGTPVLSQRESPAQVMSVAGIGSDAEVGEPTVVPGPVALTVTVVGLPPVGTPTVVPGEVVRSPGGIGSAVAVPEPQIRTVAVLSLTGVVSGASGEPTLATRSVVVPLPIAPGAAGVPALASAVSVTVTGIAGSGVAGTPRLVRRAPARVLVPPGVLGGAVGVPSLMTAGVIQVPSIATGERVATIRVVYGSGIAPFDWRVLEFVRRWDGMVVPRWGVQSLERRVR